MTKHTATPWFWDKLEHNNKWSEKCLLSDKEGFEIGKTSLKDGKFIVKSVNCHDELVKALKEAKRYLEAHDNMLSDSQDKDETTSLIWEALAKAEA